MYVGGVTVLYWCWVVALLTGPDGAAGDDALQRAWVVAGLPGSLLLLFLAVPLVSLTGLLLLWPLLPAGGVPGGEWGYFGIVFVALVAVLIQQVRWARRLVARLKALRGDLKAG